MERTLLGKNRLSPEAAEALAGAIAGGKSSNIPLPEVLIALADDLADRRLAVTAKKLAETSIGKKGKLFKVPENQGSETSAVPAVLVKSK